MSMTAVGGQEPDPQDIGQVVGRHTALRPHGVDQLRGDCPFCGSPAFRVRPDHNTFHCFGCGEAGDPQTFLTRIGGSSPTGV
jgi:DNA primase